ncbi:MAG: PAS domain-containing protein [Phenylobacterium sp.]|uniref:sensor histidine kinase n=1 Tax=Phenylobacterium sp. TaxID=1871053 RepID=UPI001A36D885|nr:PAS domain-containing protein [Phenylobacterium sp.]MBL8771826.1 PAS domain-containing protein [Phenylobacterium sp.]
MADEQAESFRILAETLPHLVWTAGDNGVVDYYNAQAANYSGLQRDASGSYDWAPIVHPDDLEATTAAWSRAVAESAPYTAEHRLRMADGSWRWHVSRATPVRRGDGMRWYGTATDIHQLKSAQEAATLNEARLRIALQSGGLGDWDWDVGTNLVTLSPRARAIYGLEQHQVDLTDLRGLVALEDSASVRRLMEATVRDGSEFEAEFRITRPDGARRWVHARALLNESDGRVLVGVLGDITEAREAEERRRLLVNELNHRVKNTLAVVQGLASQSLRSSGAEAKAGSEFLQRLGALARAHDILTAESWQPVDLADLLVGQLRVHVDEGRFGLAGPSVRLGSRVAIDLALVAHELATNAVKYGALSNATGRIEIAWQVDGERVEIDWRETGGPPVAEPSRTGFGTRLIGRALAADGGQASITYAPEGVRCRIRCPRET